MSAAAVICEEHTAQTRWVIVKGRDCNVAEHTFFLPRPWEANSVQETQSAEGPQKSAPACLDFLMSVAAVICEEHTVQTRWVRAKGLDCNAAGTNSTENSLTPQLGFFDVCCRCDL